MHGKSQIRWSKGLRNVFSLGKEKTDEEILKDEQDSADLLCHITKDEWKLIVKIKERSLVLEIAENGGSDAVARYLHDLMGYKISFNRYLKLFNARSGESFDNEIDMLKPTVTHIEDKKNHFNIDSKSDGQLVFNTDVDWFAVSRVMCELEQEKYKTG